MTDEAKRVAAKIAAKIIVESALEFMAAKANVSTGEIWETMLQDPHGATTSYFRKLVVMGANTVSEVA